jgi:hypothetical protein
MKSVIIISTLQREGSTVELLDRRREQAVAGVLLNRAVECKIQGINSVGRKAGIAVIFAAILRGGNWGPAFPPH